MNFLRKACIVFLALILPVFLYGAALSTAANTTLGNPEHIKGSLVESGIYNKVVEAVTDTLSKNSQTSGAGEEDISIDKEALQTIANNALPPEYLRSNTESVIDGIFRWIRGEVETPDFVIDLTDVKTRLADGVQAYALERTASLPACTPEQSRQLAAEGEIDPLSVPCRPSGVNLEAEIQKAVDELRTSDKFLSDTVITAEDIKTEPSSDQSVFENTQGLPAILNLLQSFPVILGILSLLTAAGIVFLSTSTRSGLRRTAKILAVTGVFLVIGAGIFYLGLGRFDGFQGSGQEQNNFVNEAVIPLMRELFSEFNKVLLVFGAIYLAIAITTYIVLWRIKKPEASASDADPIPAEDQQTHEVKAETVDSGSEKEKKTD